LFAEEDVSPMVVDVQGMKVILSPVDQALGEENPVRLRVLA